MALIESVGDVDPMFRPAPEYRVLRHQIAHLFAAQRSIVSGLEEGTFPWKENGTLVERMTIEELSEMGRNLDASLATLLDGRDEKWLDEVVGDYELSRDEWLWAMLEHEIHHCGQISLTIRLAGGTPAKIFA
jgi:uncharacterized damage-inducible protein DinB